MKVRSQRKLPLRKCKPIQQKDKEILSNEQLTLQKHKEKDAQIGALNYFLELKELNGGKTKSGDIRRVLKRYKSLGHTNVSRGSLNYSIAVHKKKTIDKKYNFIITTNFFQHKC